MTALAATAGAAGAVSADPALTDRVLATLDGATSPRLREVLRAVVAHLHAAASEVAVTEREWGEAVDFLTRVGQISDDRRQEMILLSDVLGLSMLVVGLNHPDGVTAATESTVFGPFFVQSSPAFELGADISGGAAGQPCFYSGRVRSVDGAPLAGALVEVWHSDEDGNYDVQDPDLDGAQNRGHLLTDDDGGYRFSSVLPEAYPLPPDGPVSELLRATRRPFMRPAHVHFMISAPGCDTLITHVFRAGDPHLGVDAVFGEKDSLVREFVRHDPGRAPDGRVLDQPFFTMTYDFVLGAAAGAPSTPAPRAGTDNQEEHHS